jgi:hypothetical protein
MRSARKEIRPPAADRNQTVEAAMSRLIGARSARRIAVTIFSALALGAAAPATAGATLLPACAPTSSSMPFLRFLDVGKYTPVPGGSFESGAPGWSLNGASVVAGNESYDVAGGHSSLQIQPGGDAASPAFCAAIENPTFRFFARNVSGHGALNVSLRWTNDQGQVRWLPVGSMGLVSSLFGSTSWSVSPVYLLSLQVPMLLESLGSDLRVEMVFQAEGGAWQIDDVYYDPYSR